jgi:hypothetical protein
MHLVQFLLPVYDNNGQRFAAARYEPIFHGLTERFGGVTAYQRAPARGAWKDEGQVSYDDVVVFEVMVEHLDHAWWADFRRDLETDFQQEEVVVRATQFERL